MSSQEMGETWARRISKYILGDAIITPPYMLRRHVRHPEIAGRVANYLSEHEIVCRPEDVPKLFDARADKNHERNKRLRSGTIKVVYE